MSNEIKTLGVKVSLALYERIREYADGYSISISDFIRDAINRALNGNQKSSNGTSNEIQQRFDEHLQKENEYLRQQLEEALKANQQLQADAESAKERSDTIILTLSQQVDKLTEQNQLLLEDLRPKRRWYHRLFALNNA